MLLKGKQYTHSSVILLDSIISVDKEYYPQTLLKNAYLK